MDIEKAKSALINAHNAGDVEAAREIANYIKSMDKPQAQAAAPQQPAPKMSMVEAGVIGLGQGATFGFGDELVSGVAAATAYPFTRDTGMSYGDLYKIQLEEEAQKLEKARQEQPVSTLAGEIAGGVTSGIGLAGTKAAGALGNMARRGGIIGKIGAGALAGEAAQRVYEAGTAQDGSKSDVLMREGISLGGVLGGAVPAAGVVGKAIMPKIDDALRPVVELAAKYKIPLSIDQVSKGRAIKNMQKVSQELPFSGEVPFRDKQMRAFNRALLATVGEDGDKFSRPVIDRAFLNVGKQFDSLTKGKIFNIAEDAATVLDEIKQGVAGGTYGEAGERLFSKYLDDVMVRVKDRTIDGDSVVNLRNKFSKISRSGSNVDAQTLAKDMENFIVSIIGDNAPGVLKDAKHKYKNLIVLEPLLAKTKAGNISPTELTNRVSKVYGRQFIRGQAGDIGELADIGRELLPELGGSDTTQKLLVAGSLMGGVVNPSILLASGAGSIINRAIQSGVNRNQAIINAMTKSGKDQFLKLPPPEAQKVLDSISLSLGLISGSMQ